MVTVKSVYVPLSYKDGYRVIVAPLWPRDIYRIKAPRAVSGIASGVIPLRLVRMDTTAATSPRNRAYAYDVRTAQHISCSSQH